MQVDVTFPPLRRLGAQSFGWIHPLEFREAHLGEKRADFGAFVYTSERDGAGKGRYFPVSVLSAEAGGRMAKVAFWAGAYRATAASSDCVRRLEAALRAREEGPGTSDHRGKRWLFSHKPPKLTFSLRLAIQADRLELERRVSYAMDLMRPSSPNPNPNPKYAMDLMRPPPPSEQRPTTAPVASASPSRPPTTADGLSPMPQDVSGRLKRLSCAAQPPPSSPSPPPPSHRRGESTSSSSPSPSPSPSTSKGGLLGAVAAIREVDARHRAKVVRVLLMVSTVGDVGFVARLLDAQVVMPPLQCSFLSHLSSRPSSCLSSRLSSHLSSRLFSRLFSRLSSRLLSSRLLYSRLLSSHPISSPAQSLSLLERQPSLVNAADEEGYTPLIRAAMGGHTALVEFLLDRGADPC